MFLIISLFYFKLYAIKIDEGILMTVMLILIVISFTLAISFLAAFLWAVKNNQYEDTFTPSLRILMDSEGNIDEKNDLRINQGN